MLRGRGREFEALTEAVARARAGTGSVHLVIGEAGLGKSTLVAAVCVDARDQGISVLHSRCSEDPTAPALWPWAVLLRTWASDKEPAQLAERLNRVHPLLRRLAPEVAAAAGLEVPSGAADELEGRFVVGDALGRLVAGDGLPALIVVEDLHHGDAGTLTMAEPIAAAASSAGAVVLASSRTRAAAINLVSLPATTLTVLTGLDDSDAGALVGAVAPGLDQATVDVIVHRAEGNPFFLTELARLQQSPTGRRSTPPSVQEVVRRRVDELGPDAVEVLSIAAILGPAPDLDLLSRVAGGSDLVSNTIDGALDAGLLVAEGADLRWSHDLFREAIVDATGTSRTRRIHDTVARALADGGGHDPLTLAHHMLASGGGSTEAADAGERAARLAAQAGAYEDVLTWVERSTAAATRQSDAADRRARLDGLAGRALVALNDHIGGRRRLVAAAEHLLAAGDAPAAADELLAIGSGRLRGTEEWEPPAELLERVLAAVGDRADLRSRLVGRMADMTRDRLESERLGEMAVEAARASNDPHVLISALGRRLITWRGAPLEERLRLLDAIESLRPGPDSEQHFEVLAFRSLLLFECGDLDGLERLLPMVEATVLRLGLAGALGFGVTRSLVDVLRGRFDDAEVRLADLVAPAKGSLQEALQVGLIRLLRGNLGPALADTEIYLALAAGTPQAALVHCLRSLTAATAGQVDIASESVGEVFRGGLSEIYDIQFGMGPPMLGLLGEAVAILGDADRAAELEPWLLPWEGRSMVGGMAPFIAFGVADHVLGLLAHARGDLELSRDRLDSAMAAHRSMGAPPLLARSLVVAAELALEAGDAPAAERTGRDAARLAARHGLRLIGERAARVLAMVGAAPVRGASVGGSPVALVFTDIESSTATAAALGDEVWLEQLRAHDTVVRQLVAHHGGREVKHLGDGFMLAFPGAGAAVDLARDVQSALTGGALRVRIGVHTGPVVEDDGDIFGTTVNVAARVAAAASGGEILVTDAVRAMLPNLELAPPRTTELKGVPDPMVLHPVSMNFGT